MRIEDARKLAEQLTGQEVSYDKAWWWLRKKLKVPYRKPYPKNKKTPPNAEAIMEQRLREGIDRAVDIAIKKGYSRILLAFGDETAVQDKPNFCRTLWGTVEPMSLTGRRKFYVLGAYVVGGESVAVTSDTCRKEDFVSLLRTVRSANSDTVIVLVVDNARIHIARDALNVADELDIVIVYLPPYSPHLNPIEFVWRDCKRDMSIYVFEDRMRLFLDVFRKRTHGGAYIGFVEPYVVLVEAFSRVLPPSDGFGGEYIPSVDAAPV